MHSRRTGLIYGTRPFGQVESPYYLPPSCFSYRASVVWSSAMRRLSALVTLLVLPIGSLAGDTAPNIKGRSIVVSLSWPRTTRPGGRPSSVLSATTLPSRSGR